MANELPAGVDPQNALILETTPGTIVIKLNTDIAPGHAERLKLLAREQFYDDVPFHRVIDGFMAQTGDGRARQRHRRLVLSRSQSGILGQAVRARDRRDGAGQKSQLRK